MTILTIDAGNTRIKWGLFDDTGTLTEHSAFPHNDLVNMHFPNADRVIISNVAGDVMALQLAKLLERFPLVQWLTSKQSALGVTNSYTTPSKLGTDRWAALIAAWHREKSACLIANAGTAVTIDALDANGKFIGGMILPGLELMRRNLHSATAQLPFTPITDTQPPAMFAIDTELAIYSGALNAVCGAIHQAALALEQISGTAPRILISGGNAQLISQSLTTLSHVTKPAVIVDNLVLEGLFLLATN